MPPPQLNSNNFSLLKKNYFCKILVTLFSSSKEYSLVMERSVVSAVLELKNWLRSSS